LNSELSRILHSLQRNVLRGVITAGPLFITWLVISFILGVLANAGLPLVKLLGLPLRPARAHEQIPTIDAAHRLRPQGLPPNGAGLWASARAAAQHAAAARHRG